MATKWVFAALSAIGSMVAAPAAQAALYDFTYTASWGVVSGAVSGVLQPDNNTIIVSAILNPEFDGVPGPAVPVITTLADYFGVAGPTTPEVTIDGTNNNVLACTTTGTCGDGFFFDSAGIYTSYVLGTTPAPYFAVGPSYSGGSTALYEPYSAANWSIVVVPEPATWTMMLVAMGSLGLAMRLRRNRPGLAAA